MQNLYVEVSSLDQRSVEKYELTQTIMMEHAASAMERFIRERFALGSCVLILCGSGNNGNDGRILARQLQDDYTIAHTYTPKHTYDVIVDALFGSGLNRPLDSNTQKLLALLNTLDSFRLSCDVPTGLFCDGTLDAQVFKADTTITMGALKRSLFSDAAKEITGTVLVANLGVSRSRYEIDSNWKLLDKTDLRIPIRTSTASHKGTYGHLAILCGEHTGAAVIAGSAALRFGAGLVTLISGENVLLPYELMQGHSLPKNTTAIALGMGMGSEFCDDELMRILDNTHPLVLDADIFTHSLFPRLLQRSNVILTPHPKEFTQILRICGIADIETSTLQSNRFMYVEKFCALFPNSVLVLKGANVIIGQDKQFFINPHGTVALAKGGSGDVLSGLIAALLAQGYAPLESAIQGSLAHAIASQKFADNNYAMTPLDLIQSVTKL